MTKDEALRLALEALENITSVSICEATHHAKKDRHLLCEDCPNEVRHLKAITAIKAALEAQTRSVVKDEPCCYGGIAHDCHAGKGCQIAKRLKTSAKVKDEPVALKPCGYESKETKMCRKCGQVHAEAIWDTTPPQRKPLTLEQLREHWKVAKVFDMTYAEIDIADYVLIARDVEALHGIKGEA